MLPSAFSASSSVSSPEDVLGDLQERAEKLKFNFGGGGASAFGGGGRPAAVAPCPRIFVDGVRDGEPSPGEPQMTSPH